MRKLLTIEERAARLSEHRPTCKTCGNNLEGDGYRIVMHCPSVLVYEVAPDSDPIYCVHEEESE